MSDELANMIEDMVLQAIREDFSWAELREEVHNTFLELDERED